MMSSKIAGPKKKKGISKKNKTSWRKNTPIEDIEEYLDDQRLEERLGGSFNLRKDEDIFMVDSKPGSEDKKPVVKRKARAEKPLKCFQHLTNTSKVADPVKTRNRRKLPEERVNPIVVKQDIDRKLKGVVKAKEKLQKKHRIEGKLKKTAEVLDNQKRRRVDFDFDLWTAQNEKQETKALKENDWLEPVTKLYNLNNLRRPQRKVPEDLMKKNTKLPPVEPPHPGASYNPSLKDHQELLWKAAIVELNKEKEQHRIDYHTTMMFPSKKDAPTEQTWLAEMSVGVDILSKHGTDHDAENSDNDEGKEKASDSEEEEEEKGPKLKTRKQRRKALERLVELKRKQIEKKEFLKHQEIFRLKSIRKEIKEQEVETERRVQVRGARKEAKLYQPAKLSGYKFEAPDLEIKLGEELTGNLRCLKPEGSLLEDRYKSMQKRNVIETRLQHKNVVNRKKRKKAEKRSYKMGFSWEK